MLGTRSPALMEPPIIPAWCPPRTSRNIYGVGARKYRLIVSGMGEWRASGRLGDDGSGHSCGGQSFRDHADLVESHQHHTPTSTTTPTTTPTTTLTTTPTSSTPTNRCSLSSNHTSGCTLRGADLTGKDLSDAAFSGVDLHASDWSFGTHRNTNLSNTNLSSVNFVLSVLDGIRFTGANLSDTNLQHTSLMGVSSSGITGTNILLPLNRQLTVGYLVGPCPT